MSSRMLNINNFFRIPEFIYRYQVSKKLGLNYLINIRKPFELIGEEYIKVGNAFSAGAFTRIEAYDTEGVKPSIVIGDNCFFNRRTHIGIITKLSIGNDVLLGSDVMIIDHNHGKGNTIEELTIPPMKRKLYSKGPISIGNNVWICEKATILGGVNVGDGAIIGANSVVTKDIPAFCIAVGNPARIVKKISE